MNLYKKSEKTGKIWWCETNIVPLSGKFQLQKITGQLTGKRNLCSSWYDTYASAQIFEHKHIRQLVKRGYLSQDQLGIKNSLDFDEIEMKIG